MSTAKKVTVQLVRSPLAAKLTTATRFVVWVCAK